MTEGVAVQPHRGVHYHLEAGVMWQVKELLDGIETDTLKSLVESLALGNGLSVVCWSRIALWRCSCSWT